MWETMYNSDGVGLAAPQVGRNDRIVVIDADPVADAFPECKGRKFTLINPEIEILDGPVETRNEGCLSLPDLSEAVPRVEHIRLKWVDDDFQPHEEEISGFSPASYSTNATTSKVSCISTISQLSAASCFAPNCRQSSLAASVSTTPCATHPKKAENNPRYPLSHINIIMADDKK